MFGQTIKLWDWCYGESMVWHINQL